MVHIRCRRVSTSLHVCPRCVRALRPARSLAISGSQGTRRGAGRAGAVRQGDILPDPGGRGGGNRGLHRASTECTQLGSFERSVQLYVVVSERSATKVDRLPTLTRLCSVAPLFRESPSCQLAPCIKKLVALLNGWSLRVHTHHGLGSRRAHKHPRLIGKL